jgi:putative Mg2+ transporter-C (MgtC) family protein
MVLESAQVTGDATRTMHAIITGVGFIGAGAILHSEKGTTGVTTAASVLFVAVIGAAVGLGAPLLAGVSCVLALGVLRVLGGWKYRRQNAEYRAQLPFAHDE